MSAARKSAPALAYSYLRFSRPEQASGDSVRRQTAALEAWLKSRGPAVRLDTTLTLEDRGTSGYTGDHRTDPDRHALAQFVEAVRSGRVRPGSYLVVESLDRLSREAVRHAVTFLLDLVNRGIVVVQLSPQVVEYGPDMDVMSLMLAVMEMSRGHGESRLKSERCGQAWANKKEEAAKSKTPTGAIPPCWLRIEGRPQKGNGGRFVVDPKKAAVVRRIHQMARDGQSIQGIATTLTKEGVKPISGSRGVRCGKGWPIATVKRFLTSPAVYGQYRDIPDYFPAIMPEAEYLATRAAVQGRKRAVGRKGTTTDNLFRGLLFDAQSKTPLYMSAKRGATPVYYSASWLTGGRYASIPVAVLERAILSRLREIRAADILPDSGQDVREADTLAGKRATLDAKIERLKARITEDEDGADLIDVLQRLTRERREITARLDDLAREAATPLTAAWLDTQSLITAIDQAADPQAARTKLRQLIRRIVSEVWVAVRRDYHCGPLHYLLSVHFQGGQVRNYHGGYVASRTLPPYEMCVAWDGDETDSIRDDREWLDQWYSQGQ